MKESVRHLHRTNKKCLGAAGDVEIVMLVAVLLVDSNDFRIEPRVPWHVIGQVLVRQASQEAYPSCNYLVESGQNGGHLP
jgi:hypothetical protein